MDLEKKIKLLKKYDFSAWRTNYGGVVPTIIGHLAGILGDLEDISREKSPVEKAKYFETLNKNYAGFISFYEQIDFSELSREDEDFKFFFDYRDKIIELGEGIKNLEQNILCGKEDFSKKLFGKIFQLRDMNYRKQVLDKYGITYEE